MTAHPSGSLAVVTYNLWKGRAQHELPVLIDQHAPDVLCLQEARTPTLPEQVRGMHLAAVTSRNRLGVALYVRSERLEVEDARTVQLSTSRHDRLIGGTDHRLAAARVRDRRTGGRLVLGSLHLTPFTDSNAARRRQVDDALAAVEDLGPGLPLVLAGDYNHPLLLFMLRSHLRRGGLTLAHPPSSTFHRERSLMRGKFDVAAVAGLQVRGAHTLPQGGSDHHPVSFSLAY